MHYYSAIIRHKNGKINPYAPISHKGLIDLSQDFTKQLGQRVKALRIAQGYSQDRLCAKVQLQGCDLTRSALAKVEVGQRRLYPEELRGLKQALQVRYEDLLE